MYSQEVWNEYNTLYALYSGLITEEEAIDSASQQYHYLENAQHKTNIIMDISQVDKIQFSLGILFNHPSLLKAAKHRNLNYYVYVASEKPTFNFVIKALMSFFKYRAKICPTLEEAQNFLNEIREQV